MSLEEANQELARIEFEARKKAWWDWHCANPEVWRHFERFALEAVSRGRRRISHWLIVNRIRWETAVLTTGVDFKISNDFIAFYARLWIARHPAHAGLFHIKRMRGEPEHEFHHATDSRRVRPDHPRPGYPPGDRRLEQ